MLDFHNDITAKIEYNPQNNKFAFLRQAVGAHDYIDIDTVTTAITSTVSVYVSDTTGNDSTGTGTAANPYKTILKGANSCTATKIYVVILDSHLYAESLADLDNAYFSGLYADDGETPHLSLRILDYTESDANTIFVAASTAMTGADGTRAKPYATIAEAIAATDTAHPNVMIDDSETYDEEGFEFTGSFSGLYAAIGEKPVFNITSCPIDNFTVSFDSENYFNVGATTSLYGTVKTLSNGNILVIKSINTSVGVYTYSFYIYSQTYELISGPTAILSTGLYSWMQCTEIDNNNIFVMISNNGAGGAGDLLYFVFNHETGSVIKTVTDTGYNVYYSSFNCCHLANGNIFIVFTDYDDSNYLKYYALNQDTYAVTKSITTLVSSGTIGPSCCADDYNIYISYGAALKYIILLQSDYSTVKSATALNATNVNYQSGNLMLSNGLLAIAYHTGLTSNNLYYQIINPTDGSAIITETLIRTAESFDVSVCLISGGNILFGYIAYDGSIYRPFYRLLNIENYPIKCSVNSIINGITFTISGPANDSLKQLILGNNANIDISFCTFDGIQSSTENQTAWAIYSDHEVNADHCSFIDCDKGIYSASNSAIIENNEFCRIGDGYACHIDGTAATGPTIKFNHNTLFDCYAGLQLENNGGSEQVKNNIFHDCDVYDINAETAITFTYSTYTGTLNNATAGSGVIKINPLFKNEGAIDPDDVDLQLKLRVLGYPADSPAYQLADDTTPDRDAGAWDVIPIGAATTWTSFTFEKPGKGFKVKYEPVGALVNKRKDGSIETGLDDWVEIVSIEFDGILNADFANFMAMLTCSENLIRLYPDYTTYSSNYNLYKIIYDSVNGDADHFKLTRTGRQKFGISFARAYE